MRSRGSLALSVAAAVLGGCAMPDPARAQDMEPRAYSAAPVGANFFVASYNFSTGSVVSDPTLPISDVEARVNGLAIGVGHSFNLFGDLALVTAAVPYAFVKATGNVFEEAHETTPSGFADSRFKLSVNLRGNPAMSPREFAAAKRRTIVGASLTVTSPTSQYNDTKLVNVGTNRWAFKPEIGVAYPRGRWDLDGYFGVWLFTANSDFFPGGVRRTQHPVAALQLHASYSFKPLLWLAFDATGYRGGGSQTENGRTVESQSNTRAGATLSVPVGRRYSVKFAYTSGVVVRRGTNFRTVAIAWQALWLSPRWSGR